MPAGSGADGLHEALDVSIVWTKVAGNKVVPGGRDAGTCRDNATIFPICEVFLSSIAETESCVKFCPLSKIYRSIIVGSSVTSRLGANNMVAGFSRFNSLTSYVETRSPVSVNS